MILTEIRIATGDVHYQNQGHLDTGQVHTLQPRHVHPVQAQQKTVHVQAVTAQQEHVQRKEAQPKMMKMMMILLWNAYTIHHQMKVIFGFYFYQRKPHSFNLFWSWLSTSVNTVIASQLTNLYLVLDRQAVDTLTALSKTVHYC